MHIKSVMYMACFAYFGAIQAAEESWPDRFAATHLPETAYQDFAEPLANLLLANKENHNFIFDVKRKLISQKKFTRKFNKGHVAPSKIIAAIQNYFSETVIIGPISLADHFQEEFKKAAFALFYLRLKKLTGCRHIKNLMQCELAYQNEIPLMSLKYCLEQHKQMPPAIEAAIYVHESALLAHKILTRVHNNCSPLRSINFSRYESLPARPQTPPPFFKPAKSVDE